MPLQNAFLSDEQVNLPGECPSHWIKKTHFMGHQILNYLNKMEQLQLERK